MVMFSLGNEAQSRNPSDLHPHTIINTDMTSGC